MRPPRLEELPAPPEGKTGWPWTEASDPQTEFRLYGSAWPKISVVTPSFNQGQFIEETIRSVLLQSYPNLELIIIDGGSTDNTQEIIKKYETWIKYWVSEPDRGQSHAINKGIGKATGEILFWLNSDDLVLPGTFALVAQVFSDNPETKMVIGQAKVINNEGNEIGDLLSKFTSWEELVITPHNQVRQVSTFFSKSLFDECGLVNEDINIAMDIELLSRITRCYKPTVITDFVSAFRVQEQSKSFVDSLKGYEEIDRFRKKILHNHALLHRYTSASSVNWLNIAMQRRFNKKTRMYCLKCALRVNPRIFFEGNFWFTLWWMVKNDE